MSLAPFRRCSRSVSGHGERLVCRPICPSKACFVYCQLDDVCLCLLLAGQLGGPVTHDAIGLDPRWLWPRCALSCRMHLQNKARCLLFAYRKMRLLYQDACLVMSRPVSPHPTLSQPKDKWADFGWADVCKSKLGCCFGPSVLLAPRTLHTGRLGAEWSGKHWQKRGASHGGV